MDGLKKTFSNIWNPTESELYVPPPILGNYDNEDDDTNYSSVISVQDSELMHNEIFDNDIESQRLERGGESQRLERGGEHQRLERESTIDINSPPPSIASKPSNNVVIEPFEEFDNNGICMRVDSLLYKETYTRENMTRFIIPIFVGVSLMGWILWFTTL